MFSSAGFKRRCHL
ncbi:para-aminobenzoate synthase domain protein, partial [Vibrio parahaemolyticus V-223/04]